jgi:hypothetical protein
MDDAALPPVVRSKRPRRLRPCTVVTTRSYPGQGPAELLAHAWGMKQGTAGDNSGTQRTVVLQP